MVQQNLLYPDYTMDWISGQRKDFSPLQNTKTSSRAEGARGSLPGGGGE
jgi:hypothetical protein